MTTKMTDYLAIAAHSARDEAMTALKNRAIRENVIISVCAWCSKYVKEESAVGSVAGVSHSICEQCFHETMLPDTAPA